jgi:hypothetical protein
VAEIIPPEPRQKPPGALEDLRDLWRSCAGLGPHDTLVSLDRFAEAYGEALLIGEIQAEDFPPNVMRDLYKFRRLIARDLRSSPGPAADESIEALTKDEWEEAVRPALEAYRKARAEETTAGPPEEE